MAGFKCILATSREPPRNLSPKRLLSRQDITIFRTALECPARICPTSRTITPSRTRSGTKRSWSLVVKIAAEAALDLYRSGANVTLVHRRAELGSTIKYWVRPDIENRIKAGQIRALFETHVKRIEPGRVWVSNHAGEHSLPAAQVFALTGYHPDFEFLRSLGVSLDPATNKPKMDPQTHESNVPGIFLAGVVIGGNHTSEIFIENGRFHGKQIVAALAAGMAQSQHS